MDDSKPGHKIVENKGILGVISLGLTLSEDPSGISVVLEVE